ncbi:MAG TPA: TIR domain-containing protein [Rhizomicrobium sp.]|jgi:hypothetical protein|nr:TIR domain-containing protein [Rhizomicrobium sp.]
MTEAKTGDGAPEGFQYDIFISYNSADREIVRRFVEHFRQAELRVYWDQNFNEGNWGTKVEAAIAASRRVLLFVSQHSMESGYVFVEGRLGREQNKLIPIRIDDAKLKFQFEGLIALIDYFSLQGIEDWQNNERLSWLCEICGGRQEPGGDAEPNRLSPRDQARAWLDQVTEVDAIAEALAVAVLESEAYETVLAAAEPMRKMLRALTAGEDRTPLSLAKLTRGRDKTLKAIEAEVFPVRPARLKMNVDCVRFREQGRAHALLNLVWETVDELRQPLIDWLDTLARQSDVNIRYRVAVAVGVLAQRSFPSVFESLIGRWALDNFERGRQTADLSLSVAALAPEVEDAVSSVLIKDWSAETATPPQLRAAIEIACGSTGFRLAPQAISVLKRIVERENGRLLNDARKAIADLIVQASTSDSDELFDLPAFLSALVDWAEQPGERDKPNQIPMLLFLSALKGLDPCDPDGGPSLARLFESRRAVHLASEGADGETALQACARAFRTALSRWGVREEAQNVLRNWAEFQRDHGGETDPVLQLARAIAALTQADSRDRQRVEFLFRHFYSAPALASKASQIEGKAS